VVAFPGTLASLRYSTESGVGNNFFICGFFIFEKPQPLDHKNGFEERQRERQTDQQTEVQWCRQIDRQT
jgi:hypothetical protein